MEAKASRVVRHVERVAGRFADNEGQLGPDELLAGHRRHAAVVVGPLEAHAERLVVGHHEGRGGGTAEAEREGGREDDLAKRGRDSPPVHAFLHRVIEL